MNEHDREFPGFENIFEQSDEAVGAPIDRRRFLELMGASMALMGMELMSTTWAAGQGSVLASRAERLRRLPFTRIRV